ncbi:MULTISPECIES: restriction endonuclease subunit S [Psychrobacter]|uniref:Restriction modification system DNA specificity domain protein n=1 Tax=Psychrobacter alimentarius TaxID=261164 RepID=A0ABM5ZZG4_9GAMM|nr:MULTISPECIES: restriction endonuclease subunit S [Psychrobacter]AMT97565.1 Restriction modification system DNA specificity domain protein [Psychrobacter alimentarius]QCB30139.1 restriction endonuclease subunit S [Psychrobacter sp. PAMC27889]
MVPNLLKPSQLGGIPKDWKRVRLSEVMKVRQGLQIAISERLKAPTSTSKEYITIQSIKKTDQDREYVEAPSQRVICNRDDVLMTRTGNTGIVVTDVEGAFHNNFFLMDFDKDKIDKTFLVNYLRSPRVQHLILTKAGASTIPDLNHKDFYSVEFPLAPVLEQQKIANILSTWDKAISTTERLINNSTQQKKALMQQLLTGKKRLLDDKGERFEGEWETAPLKDCVTFLNGMRKPIKQEDRADIQGQYPYFGATGIIDYVNDYIFDDELILLGEDGENILSRVVPHVFMVSGKIWVNNHAHVMKANKDKNSEFLCIYLESLDYRKFNSGSAQPKINKAVCEKIPVHFPSSNEQNKIATVLTNADKEIELLEQQLADLQQEKKALMQVLLTGKKRVVVDGY